MTKMSHGFELSFSTIAALVLALVVLLFATIYFTRGFEQPSEQVSEMAQQVADESEGELDILGWLPTLSKKWCTGSCTTDADCCPATGSCSCVCTAGECIGSP